MQIFPCVFSSLFHKTDGGAVSLCITETQCSSLARSEVGNQEQQFNNGATNSTTETQSNIGQLNNKVTKSSIPPSVKTSQTVTTAVMTLSNDQRQKVLPLS